MNLEFPLLLLFLTGHVFSDDDPTPGKVVLKYFYGQTLGTFDYSPAIFGPAFSDIFPSFVGVPHKAYPEDGCQPVDPPPCEIRIPPNVGWVAVIKRSKLNANRSCHFIEKVLNAQASGYAAVIIYDYERQQKLSMMDANNGTQMNMVLIPSAFVSFDDGLRLISYSFPDKSSNLTTVTFKPDQSSGFSPLAVLVPLAFSFAGILLITCVVMSVRWCQAYRKKSRSRVSKSQLKKIPIKKYSLGDKSDCCAICLEDFNVGEKLRVLPCDHGFHVKCVDPWLLKNKRTCPVCKCKVIPRTARSGQEEASSDSEDERAPLLPPAGRRQAAAGAAAETLTVRGALQYGTGLPPPVSENADSSDSDSSSSPVHRPYHVLTNASTDDEEDHTSSSVDQVSLRTQRAEDSDHRFSASVGGGSVLSTNIDLTRATFESINESTANVLPAINRASDPLLPAESEASHPLLPAENEASDPLIPAENEATNPLLPVFNKPLVSDLPTVVDPGQRTVDV